MKPLALGLFTDRTEFRLSGIHEGHEAYPVLSEQMKLISHEDGAPRNSTDTQTSGTTGGLVVLDCLSFSRYVFLLPPRRCEDHVPLIATRHLSQPWILAKRPEASLQLGGCHKE